MAVYSLWLKKRGEGGEFECLARSGVPLSFANFEWWYRKVKVVGLDRFMILAEFIEMARELDRVRQGTSSVSNQSNHLDSFSLGQSCFVLRLAQKGHQARCIDLYTLTSRTSGGEGTPSLTAQPCWVQRVQRWTLLHKASSVPQHPSTPPTQLLLPLISLKMKC